MRTGRRRSLLSQRKKRSNIRGGDITPIRLRPWLRRQHGLWGFSRITRHESRNTAFLLSCPLLSVFDYKLLRTSALEGVRMCTGLRTVNRSGGPHDERRLLGNPANVRRIPVPGKIREAHSVLRGSRLPPGLFRCGDYKRNPCRERGTFQVALTGSYSG